MLTGFVLILFIITSWIVFEKKNDWLLEQIQSYMLASQSGELKITSIDLRLLLNFPDVTLELSGLEYYEHSDSLRSPEERPILRAKHLFVAVEFIPLIQDELKVTDINLSNAELTVLSYQNGQLNISRALTRPAVTKPVAIKQKPTTKPTTNTSSSSQKKNKVVVPVPPPPSLLVNLESVTLTDVRVNYLRWHADDTTVILLQELEADLFRDEKIIDSKLRAALQVETLYINNTSVPSGGLTLDTDLHYERALQELTLRQGKIHYDIFSASLQGTYSHSKNQWLDVQIDASSNDLELLSTIIKPEVLKQNPDLLKRGDIYAKGRLFGELKNHAPQFDLTFGVKDLDMHLPDNLGTFRNIGFEGMIASGSAADYSQAIVEIKNLRGQLPGGFVKGQFHLRNFADPYLQYNFNTQLTLDGYDKVFHITSVKQLRGSVSLQADFTGPLEQFSTHRMDSSRSSTLALNDVSFVVTRTNLPVTGLNGIIENKNNQAALKNLTFAYGRNDMRIDATVNNLIYFLVKGEREIVASGSIHSSQLFTNDLLFDSLGVADVQDRISNLAFNFQVKTLSRQTKQVSRIDTIEFDIRNLSAQLDQLPDIKRIDAKGLFSRINPGLSLDLHELHAVMPQGKLDVSGDVLIRKNKVWSFNARAKATEFPWTYVKELTAEIKTNVEPSAKNLPVNQMELVTADLDVSASVITYPFDFTKLDIRNSRFHVQLPGSEVLSVESFSLSLDKLLFQHPENSGDLTGLKAANGVMEFSQLKIPALNAFDALLTIDGKNDTLDIRFSSKTQKAKSETGRLFMDISKKEIDYQLNYSVKDVRLEYFIQRYYKKKFMEGSINYELDLHTSGAGLSEAKQNLRGTIEINGDSLLLHGADIDHALKKFERSQNFNLTDVGAVLVAGPVGLAVTKGTDFVSLATIRMNPHHHTHIHSLLARWKLEDRQLITEDVAFTTRLNRIAFEGRIDFARDSIPGLTIAVVDKNGCSLMDQKLYGKTNALQTGKLNITKTLLGSVINFVNAVVGKNCKPLYSGKVKAPVID